MPSPFPGMDPYLEDAGGWLDVHNRLIAYLCHELDRILGKNYFARNGERIVVERAGEFQRGIYSDLYVSGPGRGAGGAAVAEATEPVRIRIAEAEYREAYLEIRDRLGNRIVTVVELLSPANKAAGSDGREKYLAKQAEVLASQVNLVEIDLLRSGAWTVAVPESLARAAASPFDYVACVNRADDRRAFDLYPIRLEDRLPRIRIPLSGDDPDVVADLQSLLQQVYDNGRYDRTIDYGKPPVPPLDPDRERWARQVLDEARSLGWGFAVFDRTLAFDGHGHGHGHGPRSRTTVTVHGHGS
ncbi:MAG: DUF4058 family protein [Planctomycetes bacterium]|nr:DUF4058 family protein [Planctomycetota bacterium]